MVLIALLAGALLGNLVVLAFNWAGTLPDGPATVVVTGLGSIGSFAAAGVALWTAKNAREDARAAEERTDAAQRNATVAAETVRQATIEREDRLRHESVRPVLNLEVIWNPLATPRLLVTRVHNHGTHTAFGLFTRFGPSIRFENDDWVGHINLGGYFGGLPSPEVVLPMITGQGAQSREWIWTSEYWSTPYFLEGDQFDFYVMYRDNLSWWWAHRILIVFGGDVGIKPDMSQWLDIGEPRRINTPFWVEKKIQRESNWMGEKVSKRTGTEQ